MVLRSEMYKTVAVEKKTILLIQSAETQGNGTKGHLEERGHKVLWAGSGLTALMMSTKEPIDLIILDVALPDIEGLDLCHRFRQRKDTHSIPIILLTTYGFTLADTAYGPDSYLAKPYRESELDERITAVLSAKNLLEQAEIPTSPANKTAGPQALTRPDLRLVAKAESQLVQEGGEQEQALPKKERDRRAVFKVLPRPTSVTDRKQHPMATAEEGDGTATGRREPSPRTALSQHHDTSPSSPLDAFKGSGDAVIDPATGLFGRPQFEAMFSKEFKRAVRFKQQMSCMLISLDSQKLGRKADEPLVKAIIGLVQKTIREVDTAAWWSGESFIVLLPNTIRTDAMQAAARTLEVVATHPFTWPDATRVGLCIGVAGLPDEGIDSEQKMIEVADLACKRAQEFSVPPPIDMRSLRR